MNLLGIRQHGKNTALASSLVDIAAFETI